jgi:hypothetical protein
MSKDRKHMLFAILYMVACLIYCLTLSIIKNWSSFECFIAMWLVLLVFKLDLIHIATTRDEDE